MSRDGAPQASFVRWGKLVIVPSFHSRLQFALEVRKAFFQFSPDVVCVELPEPFADTIVEAVQHLPYISVVSYQSERMEAPKFIPIDPADSIVESVRLALEHDVPLEFVDIPVDQYVPDLEFLPDDYALNSLTLPTFFGAISRGNFLKRGNRGHDNPQERRGGGEGTPGVGSTRELDDTRERYMAWRVQRVLEDPSVDSVLFTLGMGHWENVLALLDTGALECPPGESSTPSRYHLEIFNVHPASLVHVLQEVPRVTHAYEVARQDASDSLRSSDQSGATFPLDKYDALREILAEARDLYAEDFGEVVSPHGAGVLYQYLRNLALVRGKLVPSFFDLIVGAKNVVDDDFAGKVYDVASSYEFVDPTPEYPFIKFTPPKKSALTRFVKLRRHLPVESGGGGSVRIRRRPKEPREGAWREQWEESQFNSTVSYPPEDRRFEDLVAFIKYKARRILKAKLTRVHEFTSSLMDGLAIRETLRNWFRKKIFVKEEIPFRGEIGPVVVIFDEDEERREYEFEMIWMAEHGQESDVALYSTFPEDNLIGPGIARVELGGFCAVFPPLAWNGYDLFDPWNKQIHFREYHEEMADITDKRHEKLLACGIYNAAPSQKFILYVASRAPRQRMVQLARKRGGHEILYLPLETYSEDVVRKLRVIHLLRGKRTREFAGKYIFL
ncbi:MAG: hypothetical protein ACTSU5_15825 [Promethearchaeota archaeon]